MQTQGQNQLVVHNSYLRHRKHVNKTKETTGISLSLMGDKATLPNCGNSPKLERMFVSNYICYIKMESKQCTVCETVKLLSEFTHTKTKSGNLRIRNQCKICRCEQQKHRRLAAIDKYRAIARKKYEANKEEILKANRISRKKYSEKINAHKKQYYKSNKDIIAKYHAGRKQIRNQAKKLRRQTDIQFRISETLKSRMCGVMKRNKTDTSSKLLGCTKPELISWLESQFTTGIIWDNYGVKWHIDHVIPIAFFDMTNKSEQLLCFNWSNLQPLPIEDNIAKSDKIIKNIIVNHYYKAKTYSETNIGYQTNIERCWWQRIALWYGNNPQGDESLYEDFLKRVIRSKDPKSAGETE